MHNNKNRESCRRERRGIMAWLSSIASLSLYSHRTGGEGGEDGKSERERQKESARDPLGRTPLADTP